MAFSVAGKKLKMPIVKAKAPAKPRVKPKLEKGTQGTMTKLEAGVKETAGGGMKRPRAGDKGAPYFCCSYFETMSVPPAKRIKTDEKAPKTILTPLIALSDSDPSESDEDLKPLSVRLNEKRASLGSPPAMPLKVPLAALFLLYVKLCRARW